MLGTLDAMQLTRLAAHCRDMVCCRRRAPEAGAAPERVAPRGRTVGTQSQVTYRWDYSQPRFVPLPVHAQGAWPE